MGCEGFFRRDRRIKKTEPVPAQLVQQEANRKRAEAAKERERTEKGTFQKKTEPVVPQPVAALVKKPERSSTAKAMASKTNRGTVERMGESGRISP